MMNSLTQYWQKLTQSNSLRLRLIWVLSIAALGIWLISTTLAWIQVRKDANQMFNGQQILFA